ncbi:coiled-coil domain-containing protein 167 isoform X2 [Centrocercus urophasianus]|uniref:coiled-coil domain-containing protein 167 isoform X2 n=1 Tax=Centrocercus urophasianus TaxID=9002 RepID=UPI001C653C1B|nr:coiled-coil domain-containing protein 167 isoform X2 [Centrocercus urophasianus]
MGRKREGLSVAREIDELEEKLSLCRQSMEEVDLKLRREKLSHEGRKSLERERNLLMTKADNYALNRSTLQQCKHQSSPKGQKHKCSSRLRELKVKRKN